MKIATNLILYIIFFVTLSTLIFEYSFVRNNFDELRQKNINLPESSQTYKYASKSKAYFTDSQIKATKKRENIIRKDMLQNLLFISLSILFLNEITQHNMLSVADNNITILKNGYNGFRRNEINAFCLLTSLYIGITMWFSFNNNIGKQFLAYFVVLILFHFLLLPFIIISVLYALKNYGSKFIIACYIAYLLKIVPEIFIVDPVDFTKMRKVNIENFPKRIQNVLNTYDLKDSVYAELKPSNNMNAALIGYGKKTRIEIYGDMNQLDKDKIFSVFLHELGHSFEKSLFKKALLYFSIIIAESLMLLFALNKIAPKFAHEKIEKEIIFLILCLVYKMCIRQWMFVMYKILSHHSENTSDDFAASYGYGNELSKALFEIGIDSKDYIRPGFVYSFWKSGHPSIFDRIENLSMLVDKYE